MDAPLIKDFAIPVPSYLQTEAWSGLLTIFEQQGCDRIVIIDEQKQPLGVIRLKHFLFHLGLSRDIASVHVSNQSVQSFLQANPNFLDKVLVLPVTATLTQGWDVLQAEPTMPVVIVGAEGDCMGLLDTMLVLQWLKLGRLPPAMLFTVEQPNPMIYPPDLTTTSSPQVILQVLIGLLDQIPLPMMLQTGAGHVLVRNEAWHNQVSELQNPTLIQQAAASLLEMEATELAAHHVPESDAQAVDGLMEGVAENLGFCQLGTDTNTCLCVCPMRDGREKVWQFTKIPVQVTMTAKEHLAGNDRSLSAAMPLSPFRLGTLGNGAEIGLETDVATASETVWLLLAQDRTEQQRVTKELAARNADLTQLNRLKDEFLACISHELKTPLTAILGLSSLLKELVLGDLNDRQFRYVQLIHQSGRHLVSIVNDMLDLTRMETGQLELVLEPVDIRTICDIAYHQAKGQHMALEDQLEDRRSSSESAKPAEIEPLFTLDIEPELEYIVADALRLRQMLVHLLSNALKFTEGKQELGLTVNHWEGWIAFTVWDTGIGIPADKQHLIFQKFQQLESPLTRRFEGTGLGLVLTQRLARLHGGDVTFVSKEGEGSQFTLLLPPTPPTQFQNATAASADARSFSNLTSSATSEPLTQPTSQARLSNRLVLLVEASATLIEELATQITGLGYRVAIARSGTEALEKVRRLQPCVVFLNPLLPLLSGWDVLTLLKSYADTREIPVVVMATIAEKARAVRNQADEFLPLPLQRDQLQHTLTTVADWTSAPAPALPVLHSLTVMLLNMSDSHQDSHEIDALQEPSSVAGGKRTLVSASEPPQATLPAIVNLLQTNHHRLLEVDDLDQADLLARVWKPDVVLLSDTSPQPMASVQRLSQYHYLASLPIVTLTSAVTEAANQISGLSVFPCLAEPTIALSTTPGQPEVSALLQVIQAAAGIGWNPCILMADSLHLPDLTIINGAKGTLTQPRPFSELRSKSATKFAADWLQALVQYLQTAGFRGIIGQSWAEILHYLHHQSVDLLILYLHGTIPSEHADATIPLENALAELHQLPNMPPILVVDHCHVVDPVKTSGLAGSASGSISSVPASLLEQLRSISTRILPASIPVASLLNIIRDTLHR